MGRLVYFPDLAKGPAGRSHWFITHPHGFSDVFSMV